ncbi:MAG TPA: ATP-binding protein, partial [Ramlibacter sp.]
MQHQPGEGVARTSTLEGEEVVTGFVRLPTYGWVVAVGASTVPVRKVLLRGLGYYTTGALITLAACVLLATWLSRLISRDIHRVRELATEMGREQRVAAPGSVITEVDQIGHAVEDTSIRLVGLVDQLRDAADQAHAAGKVKDEIIAVTSHELRNPLSPIVAALHILDMKSDASTQMEREIMRRQVNHLSRLVDDLLDVSRLTRGQMAITPRRLDFRALTERVVGEARLGLEASRRPVQIEFTADKDGPLWVVCDEARMTQAINNLLGNAARHANGQPVAVDLVASDTEVRLTVRDFGTGMDSATLARVFAPFYQARDNQNELRGSLGLGLSIVRSIVVSHGGRVAARSEGLGQGSVFEIILPRGPAAEDTVGCEAGAAGPGSGRDRAGHEGPRDGVAAGPDVQPAQGRKAVALLFLQQGDLVSQLEQLALGQHRRDAIGEPGVGGVQFVMRGKPCAVGHPGRNHVVAPHAGRSRLMGEMVFLPSLSRCRTGRQPHVGAAPD